MKKAPYLLPVATLLLLSCARAPLAVPSEAGNSKEALNNPLLALSGIYSDGWIADSGSLELTKPQGSNALHVRLMTPMTNDAGFHSMLEMRIDDVPLALKSVSVGVFDASFPVFGPSGTRRITLAFRPTQLLPGGDGRHVGARLESIGFTNLPADSDTALQPRKDIAGDHVHLGSGWHALETFNGETFRWVENDAQLAVDLGKARDGILTLMLEQNRGPALGSMLVRVCDESGRQTAALILDRRQTFRVPVPLQAGKTNVFTLHVEGGGARSGDDPRVLNFRVFAIHAEPWP